MLEKPQHLNYTKNTRKKKNTGKKPIDETIYKIVSLLSASLLETAANEALFFLSSSSSRVQIGPLSSLAEQFHGTTSAQPKTYFDFAFPLLDIVGALNI